MAAPPKTNKHKHKLAQTSPDILFIVIPRQHVKNAAAV
jgi:hypothetical protein